MWPAWTGGGDRLLGGGGCPASQVLGSPLLSSFLGRWAPCRGPCPPGATLPISA